MIISMLLKCSLAGVLSLSPLTAPVCATTDPAVEDALKDYSDWYAHVDGEEVTYGPLEITLPKGYIAEDLSAHSPVFYAVDTLAEDYQPHFYFSGNADSSFSNQTNANKEALEKSLKDTMASMDGAKFVEISEFKEAKLGDYNVTRATAVLELSGQRIIDEVFCLFGTSGKRGEAAMVEFYCLDGDKDHLEAAQKAMDKIALIDDYDEKESTTPQFTAQWTKEMENTKVQVKGDKVTYGPLTMKLPKGFKLDDSDPSVPTFIAEDGSTNVNIVFGEDSFAIMSNQDYVEMIFDQTYSQQGIEFVGVSAIEEVEVNKYPAILLGAKSVAEGTELGQIICAVFETKDQLYVPTFTITFTSDVENEEASDLIEFIFDNIHINAEDA